MKNKKNIDSLQSDLSWLDEFAQENSELHVSESVSKNPTKGGQLTKSIEIGGQILSISHVPSLSTIAGHKEAGRKMKGVEKSESHKAAIRGAAAKRRGKPNGRKGIPHSELHKQRIGDSNRGVSRKTAWQGRKHRADSIEKIRQHNLNRDAYIYTEEQKVRISKSISAGKKGKPRSPEMMAKMAEQRAMNFKTPIGIFRDRSKAEKAYLELGHSKQDFKKLYIHQADNFYYTNAKITNH